MDFFTQQNKSSFKSRVFLLVFVLAVFLSLIVLYFCVTACLAIGFFSADLFINGSEVIDYRGLWPVLVAHLPVSVYGYPQNFLAWRPFLVIVLGLGSFIFIASFLKTFWTYFRGGAYLAKKLGGLEVTEPDDLKEKQLYHVVEEMALASGLPMPRIFILPKEEAINAVTAGRSQASAVIMLTEGALKHLSREELQAVVAHEFAHILNGDSSLNLRMSGYLFGLLCFYVAGLGVVRAVGEIAPELGRAFILAIPLLLIGFFFMVGGWLGKVSAGIIQAAFSRQREYLADAFAAQFTRNPKALAGALKKIHSFPQKGLMKSGQALAMKSFFIVSPARFQGLFGSHPSLKKRIKLLDPQWDGSIMPLNLLEFKEADPSAGEEKIRSNIGDYLSKRVDADVWQALFSAGLEARRGYSPGDGFGGFQPADSLELAARFLERLHPDVVAAAASNERAPALAAALFIQPEPQLALAQRAVIRDLMGERTAASAWELASHLDPDGRLPVLDLLLPALYRLGWGSGYKINKTAEEMVRLDSKLDFFEVSALHLLRRYLLAAERSGEDSPEDAAINRAAKNLLSIVAYVGNKDLKAARAAFSAGAVQFWPRSSMKMAPIGVSNSHDLGRAFMTLQNENMEFKKRLVMAAVTIVGHDRLVKISEYELLRCAAAALDFHLPLLPPMSRPATRPAPALSD